MVKDGPLEKGSGGQEWVKREDICGRTAARSVFTKNTTSSGGLGQSMQTVKVR